MAGGVAKLDCPYCKTGQVAFTAIHDWRNYAGERRSIFKCGACHEAVIFEFTAPSSNGPMNVAGDIERHHIALGRQWPPAASGTAPEDTPPTVAHYFQQGTSGFEAGSFDAAGMMFRKALETATKILDPALSGKSLIKRIDTLAEASKLTPAMAEWAHEVRLGGNDAAHEDEPYTMEQAQDLRNFIENFLRYAFTLPSAVKRRAKPQNGQPAE